MTINELRRQLDEKRSRIAELENQLTIQGVMNLHSRIAELEAVLIKVFNEKIPSHVADMIEEGLGDVK